MQLEPLPLPPRFDSEMNAVAVTNNEQDVSIDGRSDQFPLVASCTGLVLESGRLAVGGESGRLAVGGGGGWCDTSIAGFIRKQVESLEEKLNAQLQRGQDRIDRRQKVALAAVESKIASLETSQPQLDRRG